MNTPAAPRSRRRGGTQTLRRAPGTETATHPLCAADPAGSAPRCDPGLGPPEIAAAANISVRYLDKLFEAEHRSVSQYIKELRLERSRREVLDPRLADRSIAAVAFACGFGDLSGFNRAFKDAYGTSPRKVRTASP